MQGIVKRLTLEIYVTARGKRPFIDWLEKLKDKSGRYRIKERLDRLSLGNWGDYKSLSLGLYELRMHFGGGYRVYVGQDDKQLVLLLCTGNKSTQSKDIAKAKIYWEDYQKCSKGDE